MREVQAVGAEIQEAAAVRAAPLAALRVTAFSFFSHTATDRLRRQLLKKTCHPERAQRVEGSFRLRKSCIPLRRRGKTIAYRNRADPSAALRVTALFLQGAAIGAFRRQLCWRRPQSKTGGPRPGASGIFHSSTYTVQFLRPNWMHSSHVLKYRSTMLPLMAPPVSSAVQ